jgi:hypothetical protein
VCGVGWMVGPGNIHAFEYLASSWFSRVLIHLDQKLKMQNNYARQRKSR